MVIKGCYPASTALYPMLRSLWCNFISLGLIIPLLDCLPTLSEINSNNGLLFSIGGQLACRPGGFSLNSLSRIKPAQCPNKILLGLIRGLSIPSQQTLRKAISDEEAGSREQLPKIGQRNPRNMRLLRRFLPLSYGTWETPSRGNVDPGASYYCAEIGFLCALFLLNRTF